MNKEIVNNCAITISKKELLGYGIEITFEAAINSLIKSSMSDFIDLIAQDLKDTGNDYQFILTIKKLESDQKD